jgi:hypothetical protein
MPLKPKARPRMFAAHTHLEFRFAENSLDYLARGMDLAAKIAPDYPAFQTNAIAVNFTSATGSTLGFDPARILIGLRMGDGTLKNAIRVATYAINKWTEHVGPVPKLQRVGIRVQSAAPSAMSPAELIDVYRSWVFQESFSNLASKKHDFSVTLENIDGADGDRLIIGVMGYDELLSKWNLEQDRVEEANSFFTVDLDYGTSSIQAKIGDIEGFVTATWAEMSRLNDALSVAIPVGA